METGFMNRIIGLVLALVVGGLLVGGLLIPSIEAMTTTEKTFDNENNSIADMKLFETGDTWSRDSVTDAWSLNGETVSDLNQGRYNAIVTETISGRSNGQIRGVTVAGNVAGAGAVVVDESTLTLSGSGLQGSATQTYTKGFGITDKGDYVLTKYLADRGNIYILEDSQIYATGITNGSTVVNAVIHIEGTIKDGVTVTADPVYSSGANKTISVDNVQVNATPVSGYKGLYTFNEITFEITETDSSTSETETLNASYSAVIVDKTVTAELSQHMDATQIAMFGVISILGIVALVVVAANGIRNKY